MTAHFDKLLPVLVRGGIEFILIGGVAAVVHGSARVTYDVDICYSRASENIAGLVHALEPHAPYLRGAPPGLPFHWDERTVVHGLNFTLTTELGDLDLMGEVIGGGGYADLLPHSIAIEAFGVEFRCIDLPTLIRLKRAAGRPRDFEALAELEVLRAAQAAE
ncbi:MAG: hypothetical protein ABI946_05405 [Chthoniobacterales bacterium]